MDPGVRDRARIPRYAVIPTNGRECHTLALAGIRPQVDQVIFVTNGPEHVRYTDCTTIHDVGDDANVSRWWNMGLAAAAAHLRFRSDYNGTKYDVAIINDDVIVPPGWFDAVSGKMREMKAAAACSGGLSPMPWLITHAGAVPGVPNPLLGFAFMVAGELGLRANEDIPWYFSDNFMDWESRLLGGTVVIPGFHVQHLYPNGQMTGELQEANARGAQAFKDYYGVMPW